MQDGEAPVIRPCHSHRRFMEVSSLVLLHLRQSLESQSRMVDAQVERSLGTPHHRASSPRRKPRHKPRRKPQTMRLRRCGSSPGWPAAHPLLAVCNAM